MSEEKWEVLSGNKIRMVRQRAGHGFLRGEGQALFVRFGA